MTVIELPDEQAAALKAKANAAGLTLEAWLKQLADAEREPPPAAGPLQTAADIILDCMRDVPAEIMAAHAQGRRQPARPLHLRLAQARGMTALFADTFYWVALADSSDSAHQRALTSQPSELLRRSSPPMKCWPSTSHFSLPRPRRCAVEAATSVQRILANPVIRVIPQSRASFLAGLDLYSAAARQGLQPGGLHFDADDAQGRADRSAHQ